MFSPHLFIVCFRKINFKYANRKCSSNWVSWYSAYWTVFFIYDGIFFNASDNCIHEFIVLLLSHHFFFNFFPILISLPQRNFNEKKRVFFLFFHYLKFEIFCSLKCIRFMWTNEINIQWGLEIICCSFTLLLNEISMTRQ